MGTMRRKPSILLTQTWDGDEEFSTQVDLAHCNRAELLELLRGTLDESTLATATHKTLLGAARQRNLERRLRGSEALMYRASVIMQYLARLEHTHNCKEALRNVKIARRNQWAIVSKVPPSSIVKVGSVIAAIDGQSTLFSPFEQTQRLLHEAKHGDGRSVTFRWAPFHQGWVEIDFEDGTSVCYLILAYGYAAYFDQQETPRKRIGSVSLTGATLTPVSSPRGSAVELNDSKSNRILLRPPPTSCDKWKPIIPIVDLAAVFVVAVAHANGADDVRALEMCRVISRAPSAMKLQETIRHSMSVVPFAVPDEDFIDNLPNLRDGDQSCTDQQLDVDACMKLPDTQYLKYFQSTHVGPHWTTRLLVSWPFNMAVPSDCRDPPLQEWSDNGSSENADNFDPKTLESDTEMPCNPSKRAQDDTKLKGESLNDTSMVNVHGRNIQKPVRQQTPTQQISGMATHLKRKATVLCQEACRAESSDLPLVEQNCKSSSQQKSAIIDRPADDFHHINIVQNEEIANASHAHRGNARAEENGEECITLAAREPRKSAIIDRPAGVYVNLVQNDVQANASFAHRENASAEVNQEECITLAAREPNESVTEKVQNDDDAACTLGEGVTNVHDVHGCIMQRPSIRCKLVNGSQPILYIDTEHLLQCRKSAEAPWSTLKLMLCCESENTQLRV